MFGFAATDPLAPELERLRFHLLPHHCDHLRLGESELKLDRLKGRSVFPGHFDNAIKILARERFHRRSTQECERYDASAHAEVTEGRQPRLKFRPVKTAGIIPLSGQIHMAMGGDRRWRQIEGADPTRNTRASASYCLEV